MRARALPGTTIALLLVLVAILLTANEVRFQGCVNAQWAQVSIRADHPAAGQGVQQCSRIPFRY